MSFKFDGFVLDPESRVLRKDGLPIPTTGKILDLLILLVERHGKAVEKDVLLSQLWPTTVVEEANLTQSIFTLRKLLNDNPKDHHYVATVAGRGYQFVAPVVEIHEQPAIEDGEGGAVQGRPRRNAVLRIGAILCSLLLFTIALWFWAGSRSRSTGVLPPKEIPFTSLAGMVRRPAFSPDGKQIAYSWWEEGMAGYSIFVKLTGTGGHLRLTVPPGSDNNPAWSPDGTRIVFYRTLAEASGYYIISALGGAAHRIVPTDMDDYYARAAWFPDGKRLVVVQPTSAEATGPGTPSSGQRLRLVTVDIATGQQTVLTSPPSQGRASDVRPVFSPDGHMLAFVHQLFYTVGEVYLMPVGGRPRRLGALGFITGLDWTADSREIVYSVIREPEGELWRMPIDGRPTRRITSNTASLTDPTVARHGDQLAYALATMHETPWQVELSSSDPPKAGAPKHAIYSTRLQAEPTYSPDGRKVAFSSDRSGTWAIWVSDPDGDDALQLTFGTGLFPGSPCWSPDGAFIAFDARQTGNSEIYVVPAGGGEPRRLTRSSAEDLIPSWSRDGKWIYFASNRGGDFQVWSTPAAQGESTAIPAIQITKGGGLNAVESADGKYLYFAKGRQKTGLWRKLLTSGLNAREEPVLDSLEHWGWWSLGARGIFFLESGDSLAPVIPVLKYLDLASRRITPLLTLTKPVNKETRVITVAPDGHHVIYEAYDDLQNSNIILVEDFR